MFYEAKIDHSSSLEKVDNLKESFSFFILEQTITS